MGSACALNPPDENNNSDSEMAKLAKGKAKSATSDSSKKGAKASKASEAMQKRSRAEEPEKAVGSRKMPRRAAACSDFKDKSVRLSEKSQLVETKRLVEVEDEVAAIALTSGQNETRPNRRLTDFVFHDADGNPKHVEMLEIDDLYISGVVLSLEESSGKEKEKGVRCEGFGRIESWSISGYEDGAPVVWVTTDIADYDCVKPASRYKKMFDLFHVKASVCVEVYKRLSRSSGGNPDLSVEELLAGVVRSMSASKNFPHGTSIKDFIISQGEFIYNQLVGLDETSKNNDQVFIDLPVLAELRDESKKHRGMVPGEEAASGRVLNTSLKIGDGEKISQSISSDVGPEEDEDTKLARLLQEEEYWQSMNKKKGRRPAASSTKYYIKINEDEIANDYPLPAYYKSSVEETDEYVIFDNDMEICNPADLPRSMLHDWSLYNSDSRLISLELLPMKPCADIDVTIYGSGKMTSDDGSGFCLDGDNAHSSSSGDKVVDGIPIYLSAVKEWMIEFGASMVFVSIRTDMAWYRLGKPSKQYAPWYETVIKTAKLAISIITMLKEQSRVARLSFGEIIRKVSEYGKDHPAFISSTPVTVERFIVVHGQIFLQQFAEFPDHAIRNCPFVFSLQEKMEQRHHTKWLVKKKMVLQKEANMNPRAAMQPITSSRKAMPATTTKLINRIWGEFYSNYLPEASEVAETCELKEEEEVDNELEENEEDLEEAEEQKVQVEDKFVKPCSASKPKKSLSSTTDIVWHGEVVGKTSTGKSLYKQAFVRGESVSVGGFLTLETVEDELPPVYLVEYMYEKDATKKMVHGRLMLRGVQTVLGNCASERELFLTNDCLDFELENVKESVVAEIRKLPWGHQHRKVNALKDKADRERAEDRKRKGLPMEYYCRSLYVPEKGAFFCIPTETFGVGNGCCNSCEIRATESDKETFTLELSSCTFVYQGTRYSSQDYMYVAPHYFASEGKEVEKFKSGRNVGLQAFVICQLLGIETSSKVKKASPDSTNVKVRIFYRPEDISQEKAYCSDIREVYYSEQTVVVPVVAIEGKCDVRKKQDLPSSDTPTIFDHIFFCQHMYDPDKGAVKQLPANIKLSSSKGKGVDNAEIRKKKGKCKEGENDSDGADKQIDAVQKNRLATLDIFAGCGGLSEGLERAGVSQTKWAIEYEEPAGEAFKLNHPEALVFVNNCNVILSAIMSAHGDEDDCISTSEATELAAKLDEKEINNLPRPGDVEFINGGPPCQGFSGMNRFNYSAWSKVQCEMILAFLSFAEYFRPRFFLLENVRNFVSFNKGQTFRLTVASLLEMGYQVRFGILEAGAFGVSQSRKRAFIWAASPEEVLPEWPEPMHVFNSPELKISLSGNTHYAAARSTANGAPFRSITVRDTIGDLPDVGNGASSITMEYKNEPVSFFQKKIRGDTLVLTDHISKEMNELNLIRCKRIPKRPGCDWRDLPDEKVRLSTGQMVDLIPWCLPNTAKRHNQWKGLFGRLDWEGNFPTSITDPQPMGKVGMCFHPDQDRILTVRECARSQGFPDAYKFAGNIQHKHRQIGNAVPPPLAFALGKKLKEAVDSKSSSSSA